MAPSFRRLVSAPMTNEIPAGFEPHFRKSPFTDPWEPLYSRKTDQGVFM